VGDGRELGVRHRALPGDRRARLHRDTIVNSLGDILACALGVVLARALALRRALVAFALIEIVLLVWIKDSLLLNVTMLIYAIPPIKAWQLGR
jgi:hypothetical protein